MRVASEQDSGDVCRRLKKRGGKYFNKSQKRVICGPKAKIAKIRAEPC